MGWYESVRDQSSPSGYSADCENCSAKACVDRDYSYYNWCNSDRNMHKILIENGPPKHFTMDNPDCACHDCLQWATYFSETNTCRQRRGVSELVSYYGVIGKRPSAAPVGRYEDSVAAAGPKLREYALHYTYWLNMPNMVHTVKESGFARDRDDMYNTLSKKWPNINIISIDRIRN